VSPAQATLHLIADKSKFSAAVASAVEDLGRLDRKRLSGIQGQIDGLGKSLSGIKSLVGGLFAIDVGRLGVSAFRAVAHGLRSIVNAGRASQQAMDDLRISLQAQNISWEQAKAGVETFVAAFTKAKSVKDDDIINAIATLVKGGRDLNESYRQMPFVLDIAARGHMKIVEAAELLNRVQHGQFRALKQFGIDFQATGNMAQDVVRGTQLLFEQVQGAHELALKTDPLKVFVAEWENLKSTVGGKVLPIINQNLETLGNMLKGLDPAQINKWAESAVKSLGDVAAAALRTADALSKPIETIAKSAGREVKGLAARGLAMMDVAASLPFSLAARGFAAVGMPGMAQRETDVAGFLMGRARNIYQAQLKEEARADSVFRDRVNALAMQGRVAQQQAQQAIKAQTQQGPVFAPSPGVLAEENRKRQEQYQKALAQALAHASRANATLSERETNVNIRVQSDTDVEGLESD
jgi:hypothetical protein